MQMKQGQRKTWQILLTILPMIMLCLVLTKTDVKAATTTKTMANNKIYTITNKSYSDVVYHKITIPASGYIRVDGFDIDKYNGKKYSLVPQLCNSQKKVLEGTYYARVADKYPSYKGVKKGTYYLRVTGSYKYKIRYIFTKYTNTKFGTTKAKAATLKSGQKLKVVFPAGGNGSTSAYYKIKVPHGKRMYLNWSSRTNDVLRADFYTSSNKNFGTVYGYTGAPTKTNSSPLPAGTYYVKIKRYNNDRNISGAFNMSITIK